MPIPKKSGTRDTKKSGTSDVKKATRQNTILYVNLQEKCRYQKKSGTSDTKKNRHKRRKKKCGTSERLTLESFRASLKSRLK